MVETTILIPCFNERHRLPPYLASLVARFNTADVRLVIVDDGSDAEEFAAICAVVDTLRTSGGCRLELEKLSKHEGKGAALHQGFRHADTPIVGFVDADGSVSADDCASVLSELETNADVDAAIASRVKMLGKTVVRHGRRHALGRVFATVLAKLYAMPVYDSQCGCKFFRRDAIAPLLRHIESRQWLWDTQLLILLHRQGRRIFEVPVSWHETSGSKLSLLSTIVTVPYELWSFRRRLARKGL